MLTKTRATILLIAAAMLATPAVVHAGLTHCDIFLSPQLPATVPPFLDGKASSANWANQVRKYL